jgi:hypothetical protein
LVLEIGLVWRGDMIIFSEDWASVSSVSMGWISEFALVGKIMVRSRSPQPIIH